MYDIYIYDWSYSVTELLKGWGGHPSNVGKKNIYIYIYINKNNFNFGFEIYILGPPLPKFYKLTQEIQQIDNKKKIYNKKNAHIWIIRKIFGQIAKTIITNQLQILAKKKFTKTQ